MSNYGTTGVKTDTELMKHAAAWLTKNKPDGKTLADYRKLFKIPKALKTKHKKGAPIQVNWKTTGTTAAQKRRALKSIRLDPKSAAKIKQLKADKDLMEMFTGEKYGIEHRDRVKDFAERSGEIGHGADDIHNQFISPDADMKIKNELETMADMNNNPWHITSDNATGKPRIVNINEWNAFHPDDGGFVVDSLEEAKLLKESMKQGKNLGVDERKLAYLIQERVNKSSTLDNALKQFKVYGSIQKSANKANKYSGISNLIENASTAAKTGKTIKTLQTGAKLATVGSLLALGPVGAAFGAVDTAQRTQKYKQTGNKLDGIQAWMSGVSTATGATGIGEVVSMPLDIVNLIMDAARYKRTGPMQGSRARFN